MAWTVSGVFKQTMADMVQNTVAFDLDTDVPKVALYGTTPTPDKEVSAANSAYNVAQWVTANEIFQAGQWAQAGVALASAAVTVPSGAMMYDAADTASGAAATLTAVFGCLVYDDTLTTPVVDQGLCFNYFGGTQSVTAGTFTVVWSASGIFRITV